MVTYLQDHRGAENQHLGSLTITRIGPVRKTQGNSGKCRVQSKKGVLVQLESILAVIVRSVQYTECTKIHNH